MIGAADVIVYVFLFTSLYFEVFMLITFLERAPVRVRSVAPLTRYPSVAVIIPCRNEANTIAGTIESVLALDYPQEKLSVMVIDDGSTDNTYEIGKRYEIHPNVNVFTKKGGGKHTALNYGIERSNSEFIIGLDADSFVQPYALREMMRRFEEEPDIMAVTPALRVQNPKNFLEYIQRAEYSLSIFYRFLFGRLGALFVTPGPFSIYRKEVFEKIGLFRPAYNTEDMEMAMRMQKHFMRIENAPTAHVETVVPTTLRALLRQRIRWVQGFLQNGMDYRHMFFSPRHGNLGLFVLPAALISFFGALYFAGYLLVHAGILFFDKFVQIKTIGVAGSFGITHFDWFYLSSTARIFVILGLLILTATLILIGKRMANERLFSRDVAYYLAFYGFLAPLGLAKALYNTALTKESLWK